MESFFDGKVILHCGDSREVLKEIPDESVDSAVMDPPYALVSIGKRFGAPDAAPAAEGVYGRSSRGFMGQDWDTGETAFAVEFWREVWRVLKPGAHLIAFSGTRTYHRMAVAIEDAGFEIRDQKKFMHAPDAERDAFLASLTDEQRGQFIKLFAEQDELGQLGWVYGSGFPKSHDVSKAIDKAAGAVREVLSERVRPAGDMRSGNLIKGERRADSVEQITAPATAEAREWQGWGTALKPAWEPICLARKPLSESSVAANVLRWGTGAINVDGARIPTDELKSGTYEHRHAESIYNGETSGLTRKFEYDGSKGRFPANLIHDGSEEVLAAFPESDIGGGPRAAKPNPGSTWSVGGDRSSIPGGPIHGDSGSAARFFYSAKADAEDRTGSKHPTVKPLDLMQYLCRLITPPGGVVLDAFAGTGTTGEAAWREGFRAIIIERSPDYQEDIRRRMSLAHAGTRARKRKQKPAEIKPLTGGMFGEPEE